MVASISARGGVQAALRYYAHLGKDDYYLRDGGPPGRWTGEGAGRLSLSGPVTKSEFEAALKGIDPKTGERLAALGGRVQTHAAGWDMTFSAPKSVSVLWALSEERDRAVIEGAHRSAVAVATQYLERTAAWARRGKGGAVRERTAGLLMAERSGDSLRVAAIPRRVERAFSKRRQAIEAAAAEHGYRSAKGMELAALRTRRAKRDVGHDALFEAWRAEARELGFELKRDAARAPVRPATRVVAAAAVEIRPTTTARRDAPIAHAASTMTGALQEMNQPAGMPGLAVDLRQREREFSRGRSAEMPGKRRLQAAYTGREILTPWAGMIFEAPICRAVNVLYTASSWVFSRSTKELVGTGAAGVRTRGA